MSNLKFFLLNILIIISLHSISQNRNLELHVQYLLKKTTKVDPQLKLLSTIKYKHILDKILLYKEEAIPYLIEAINYDKQYVDYHGALSSNVNIEYCGIICIKIIEKIINPEFKCEKIYKNQERTVLTLEDMNHIKKIYEDWWNENQQNVLKKNGYHNALSGSIYSWEVCDKEYKLSERYY